MKTYIDINRLFCTKMFYVFVESEFIAIMDAQ